MPESAELNILIETGADFVMYKTIRDDQNNPIDLTGATIASHLREFAEAAECFEFACMHNGQGGKITVTMPKETTSQIAFASGVYDVKVTLADGFTTYTLHGEAEIREGVTKSYDGKVLFLIGIGEYDGLPEVGNIDRLYFVYEERRLYRWNGTNYVAIAVGNGIRRIDLMRSDIYNDYYRITFDDNTHYFYTVINGGVKKVELVGTSGDDVTGVIDTYRMTYQRGHQTVDFEYQVKNGRLMYPAIDIDLTTGDMIMLTPEGYMGPTFRLDDTTGDLLRVIEE